MADAAESVRALRTSEAGTGLRRGGCEDIPGWSVDYELVFHRPVAPFLIACAIIRQVFCCRDIQAEKHRIIVILSLAQQRGNPDVWFIQPGVFDVSLVQGSASRDRDVERLRRCLLSLRTRLEEASFVTPFYQTVHIFAYFLGYFTWVKRHACSRLVRSYHPVRCILVEVGPAGNAVQAKRRGIDLGASFLSAANASFSVIALDKGFWVSLFGVSPVRCWRFGLAGLRSKLPQRFPRPLQAVESRGCGPYRAEQDIVQRQRSRDALRHAPGAGRVGSSREFVPATFPICIRYRG